MLKGGGKKVKAKLEAKNKEKKEGKCLPAVHTQTNKGKRKYKYCQSRIILFFCVEDRYFLFVTCAI